MLLDLGATADLDVTTGDMLAALVGDLHEHGVTVMLAQVKGRVRDRLRRTGLMERIGGDNVHLSIPAGVVAFQALGAASGLQSGDLPPIEPPALPG